MSYDLIIEVISQGLLFLATFMCALIAGFLFAFSVVVMPGLKKLNDRSFIHAFQEIDGVIQNAQPLFIFVWLGSIVTLVASAIVGFGQMGRWDYSMLVFSTIAYFLGVQVSTVAINIPLNNQLQEFDVETASEFALDSQRKRFESRWNTWNVRRTIVACLVTALLILVG